MTATDTARIKDAALTALVYAVAAKLDAGASALRTVARRHGATTEELDRAIARGINE